MSQKEFYIDCDGLRLHSKLDRPDGVDKGPLCILFHGFTGNMEEDHIIAVQKEINASGVSVLRVELYGHGGSDGKFMDHTLFKWVTNALAVVRFARSLDFVTDLYVSGHSQGGLLAMLISGMCPDIFKGALLLSPAWMIPEFCRKGNVLGGRFDPLCVPDKIEFGDWELSGEYIRVAQTIHVEEVIKGFERHVLIVHGEMDETVPWSFSNKALEIYKDASLITVKGADHCFTDHLKELADGVREMFKAR